MATEAAVSNRPRPVFILLLLFAVVAYVASQMFSAGPPPAAVSSTPTQRPAPKAAKGQVAAEDLDVRLESLNQKAPPLGEGSRNPFRFEPKAPPPPPEGSYKPPPTRPVDPSTVNPGPPPPPPGPPRIGETVKFIGVVETTKGKIGAFSIWDPQTRECRGVPSPGKEGDVIEGRYRVVRLGIESATLEYLDGRGREPLPLNGQACVAK